jgi:hypothetical protein
MEDGTYGTYSIVLSLTGPCLLTVKESSSHTVCFENQTTGRTLTLDVTEAEASGSLQYNVGTFGGEGPTTFAVSGTRATP